MAMAPPPVRVASRRVVEPLPRPRQRIPLTAWDLALLPADYLQYGLLFAPPPIPTASIVDHLQASLAGALAYYPVAGRLATDHHRDSHGNAVGCYVSVDCAGQGVEILHAVADGLAVADVVPPDADVPAVVPFSLFPLDGAINYDGHELPLFVAQVTELADGVFVGFSYNHTLSDGAALWDFLNAWAVITRARLAPPDRLLRAPTPRRPVFDRWSPDVAAAAPLVLPYADLAALLKGQSPAPPPQLRERVLHFSVESLTALKERARQELLAAGDEAGAAAVTRFQALSSLLWRSVARARRLAPGQGTVCRFVIDNRQRLRPPLPAGYFGNSVYAISTETVAAPKLPARGHGWAAAAVGRAVAAHTDAAIRARVAAWTARPVLVSPASATMPLHGNGVVIAGSPRFDVYGCDFGWGKPMAVRSGRAAKYDGRVSLFPGRDGGGSVDADVALAPEHMAALEQDGEFWAAVSPEAAKKLD